MTAIFVRVFEKEIPVEERVCTVPVAIPIGDGCFNDSWEDRTLFRAELEGYIGLGITALEAAQYAYTKWLMRRHWPDSLLLKPLAGDPAQDLDRWTPEGRER